jgi:hypothetical protein
LLLQGHVRDTELVKIRERLASGDSVVSDDAIEILLENNAMSREHLSQRVLGLPSDDIQKANIEHAERAARIAAAQSDVSSRGVSDLGDLSSARRAKE